MKRKKIIFSILALAVIGSGWYGYGEYNRKVKDLKNVRAQLHIGANDLIREFEKNEKAANELYLDKIIEVKGIVKTVEKSDRGHYAVILGAENNMSSVRCSMDSSYHQQVMVLASGTVIIMKGACTGYNADELLGSDVILNRCVVVN